MSLVNEKSEYDGAEDRMSAHHGQPYLMSPVLLFTLLMVPIVINCFFIVYALVGWILEGRDKFNWSLEAVELASWTALVVATWCALQLLYARWKKLPPGHILRISSYGHIVIAVLMTLSVIITVRL